MLYYVCNQKKRGNQNGNERLGLAGCGSVFCWLYLYRGDGFPVNERLKIFQKMLDKQPKVWYNDYRKKQGEQNVQDYQWCSRSVRGAVCVRNDYGKCVKKGRYINGQEERVGCVQKVIARRGARNVALAETGFHRKEQESLQPQKETQKSRRKLKKPIDKQHAMCYN